MIGKRGNISQHVLFLVIEITIGALILLGATHIVLSMVTDSETEIVAKDLSLTISTLISSPSNIYFSYAPNTEDKKVIIEDEEINVIKDDEKSKYKIYGLKGVTIEDAALDNVLSIPLVFEEKKLIFSHKTKANLCKGIPDSMSPGTEVYLDTYTTFTTAKREVEKIKELIEIRQRTDTQKIFNLSKIERKETINVILSVNENSNSNIIKIEYYESFTNKNYRKIACMLSGNLEQKKFKELGLINQVKQDTTPQIIISIGNKETLKKHGENPQNLDEIAKTIYETLKEAIKWM